MYFVKIILICFNFLYTIRGKNSHIFDLIKNICVHTTQKLLLFVYNQYYIFYKHSMLFFLIIFKTFSYVSLLTNYNFWCSWHFYILSKSIFLSVVSRYSRICMPSVFYFIFDFYSLYKLVHIYSIIYPVWIYLNLYLILCLFYSNYFYPYSNI